MRKIFVSVLVFVVMLASSSLFNQRQASAAVPHGYISVPSKVKGVIVYKVFTDKRAQWSQENYYFYMRPTQARKFAGKLELSAGLQVVSYIAGVFAGPYGNIVGAGVLLASLNRSGLANKIRAQSEKGSVRVTVIKNRYNTTIGNVTYWNGKYVNIASSGLEKYKNRKYLYAK